MSLLSNGLLPGENAGLRGQADEPLDLVGQPERLGVADGGGQHFCRRVLVPGSGKHVSGGNPFDDPPLRSRRPVACREAFRQIDGLAGPAGGKQTAEADLPDGKGVEQDFVPWRGSEGLDALTGDGVKQFRLPGVGGGAGEQDQPGSLTGRVIVDLQGLPDPDRPGDRVASFTEFVAVHSQHGRQQLPIAKVPCDTQCPAGPPGGGSQPFLGQQMPERDPEVHAGLGQQPHRLSFGMPGGDAGSSRVISGHSSLTASAARPLWRAMSASRITELPNASMAAKSASSGPTIPSMCGGMASAWAIRVSVPRSVTVRRPHSIMEM